MHGRHGNIRVRKTARIRSDDRDYPSLVLSLQTDCCLNNHFIDGINFQVSLKASFFHVSV